MRQFGLIGKTLSHSFSKNYFTEKFKKENIKNCAYGLYELAHASELKHLVENNKNLRGLNVTIPFKNDVIPLLDALDSRAKKIGAVNVIKITKDKKLIGYNSDYYGFKNSLEKWLGNISIKAVVLGTGGASKAVTVALDDLEIPFVQVSRAATQSAIDYGALNVNSETYKSHHLIINTTPLGMYPKIDATPDLQYDWLTNEHYMYDLVYNPEETLFMKKGGDKGAQVKNGLEMLMLQAEKSWEIWNREA